MAPATVHPSAFVDASARLGSGTRIWHLAQVRERAVLGDECILGKGAYVGEDVHIGNRVKIQNNASVYTGSTLEDGVFIGPHVCLTNDRVPRAVNRDGSQKGAEDWQLGTVLVRTGAALGAGCIVVAGVTIGRWAMVGAGAVVTRDIPDYALAVGNPARLIGYVCACGHRLEAAGRDRFRCPVCATPYTREGGGQLRPIDELAATPSGLGASG